MTSSWTLVVITFISLLQFSQATFDSSSKTNLAVYWVRLPPTLPKPFTHITYHRDKATTKPVFYTTANKPQSTSSPSPS